MWNSPENEPSEAGRSCGVRPAGVSGCREKVVHGELDAWHTAPERVLPFLKRRTSTKSTFGHVKRERCLERNRAHLSPGRCSVERRGHKIWKCQVGWAVIVFCALLRMIFPVKDPEILCSACFYRTVDVFDFYTCGARFVVECEGEVDNSEHVIGCDQERGHAIYLVKKRSL